MSQNRFFPPFASVPLLAFRLFYLACLRESHEKFSSLKSDGNTGGFHNLNNVPFLSSCALSVPREYSNSADAGTCISELRVILCVFSGSLSLLLWSNWEDLSSRQLFHLISREECPSGLRHTTANVSSKTSSVCWFALVQICSFLCSPDCPSSQNKVKTTTTKQQPKTALASGENRRTYRCTVRDCV